ncbi:MAG: multiheme c-type cytochrome [Gemmatimonadaceae bacterium]
MNSRRIGAIAALVLVVVLGVAAVALARPYQPEPVQEGNAVGDATCISCHQQKSRFEMTAHHLTSRQAAASTIDGSFTNGANVLTTSNPALHFRMDSTASGFYETAVTGRGPDTTTRTERIDIVTGSGRKGQSYLSWRNEHLFQLPISFWRGLGWINSPGYRDGIANFDRPIAPRCLECHSTGIESMPEPAANNGYRLTSVKLGVSCETCHGSGLAHVKRETLPLRGVPRVLMASRIVNPGKLPRERQVDGCALCHGGLGGLRTPAFSYVPGQPLAQHLRLPAASPNESVDVHGNQVALLERSACFRSSQMTCATCHNVHQTQRDATALSGRCLSCHTVQSCGLFPTRGNSLLGKCADCHMPRLPSNTIVSDDRGRQERPLLRTHWIKVYPEMTAAP